MYNFQKIKRKYYPLYILLIKKIFFNSKVNPRPLFILGNPKSGTTVIANLLSKATKKTLTSDIKSSIKYVTLKLDFKLLDFSEFIKKHRYEFSKDIIKEPSLSFYTDELIKEFPEAKFIWIVRNPHQNIRSILNRLKIPGNLKKINFDDFLELKKTPAWKVNLQSKMYGHQSSNYIEAMAFRWNYAINIYKKNKDKIILIKYEDFLSDKKQFIDSLAFNLDINLKESIDDYLNVQYQPKGNANLDLNDFFGIENYNIIKEICEENMKELGY